MDPLLKAGRRRATARVTNECDRHSPGHAEKRTHQRQWQVGPGSRMLLVGEATNTASRPAIDKTIAVGGARGVAISVFAHQ